jgi:hypothetical protein
MPAPPYYVDIVSCEENCPVVCNFNVPVSCKRRNGSTVSPEDNGWIPRGSTTRATPGNVDLMWILINPGSPLPTIEHNLYSEKEGAKLADAAWALTERVLEGKEAASPTLSETLTDAATVLKCEPLEVLDRCMVTNIVRCSTPVGWGSAFEGLSGVIATKRQIIRTCYQKHLMREIGYWKPRAIVAGSATSRDALCDTGLEWKCRACGVMSPRFWDRSGRSFVCRACRQPTCDWGFIAHPTARANQGGRYSPDRPKNLTALSDMMSILWN